MTTLYKEEQTAPKRPTMQSVRRGMVFRITKSQLDRESSHTKTGHHLDAHIHTDLCVRNRKHVHARARALDGPLTQSIRIVHRRPPVQQKKIRSYKNRPHLRYDEGRSRFMRCGPLDTHRLKVASDDWDRRSRVYSSCCVITTASMFSLSDRCLITKGIQNCYSNTYAFEKVENK